VTDPDDIRYQEALRQYQVDVAAYETAAKKYKQKLHELKDGDIRPSRPIPPIPPVRPVKLAFAEATQETRVEDVHFNDGVDAAAKALESVGEKELANWVRKHRR